jgi:uncharacterized protein
MTAAAMRSGADVIFQATFFDGRWRGHADFLLRREDRPSDLGSWSYDIADTKLARRVKAAAILQMCVYGDLLEQIQGIPPETVSVVTGDGVMRPHRLADYAAYYRAARRRFEDRVFDGEELPATYPEPVDHCRVCPWFSVCIERRRADDHLSLVANVTRSQRRRLVDSGVSTVGELAAGGATSAATRIPPRILDRLERQARLQVEARPPGQPGYELLPPRPDDPGKGLAGLPAPSPLDVFFDIEADPWAEEGGLEYLFGWAEAGSNGQTEYRAIWAHDRAGEKAMLEQFVDLVMERLARDPAMHVYHYGAYESGALKRLMQRHATREDEIDVLLRGHVLVNLYDHVVRQALQAGLESYSIKKLETFYMPEREGGITQAGFSVIAYEGWLESQDPAVLDSIAAYNRDDCVSDLLLRDWLEGLRLEALRDHPEWFPGGLIPRPAPEDGAAPENLVREQAETRAREDRLREGVPDDPAERSSEQAARWLLAGLIDWNRREAKPQWWDYFRLVKAPTEELVADPAALGELEFVEDLGSIKRSALRRYRFDPAQETKLDEGKAQALPAEQDGEPWGVEIVAIDSLAGTVDIKTGWGQTHPRGLIANQPPGTAAQREALGRIADDVIERGLDAAGRYRAARDLLLRRPPGATGEPLARPDETALDAARRVALDIDEGVLAIQGPPGTGKTYTAARMIVDLVRDGRKVGVTAQSHRVIANVLEAIAKAAREAGVQVGLGQKTDDGELPPIDGVERVTSNEAARDGITSGRWSVLGGTAWLWSREEFEGAIDVVFVDEAGQFSLANALSVSVAAPTLVLLGDPNQLPQVSNGVHPDGAGSSALEHLVNGAATIPPNLGLFLERTYRLHPRVNDFISEAFYEGRLEPAPENERQALGIGQPVGGVGIRHIALAHAGATNRSREEAAWITDAIASLIGRPWTDCDGVTRGLRVNDVLVVAPYNAQVAEIARTVEQRLGTRPNVGTVDRFQGREAPVAIYSMTTSTPEDAPREFEFLYSGNRLNVAISRARGLAVLLATPELLRVACRTPEHMRLVSALCRLVEVAAEQRAEERGPREPPAAVLVAAGAGPGDVLEVLDLGLA